VRNPLLILIAVVAVAAVVFYLWFMKRPIQPRQVQAAAQQASTEMEHQLSTALAINTNSLALQTTASLQGSTTVLALTFTNPNPVALTDVTVDKPKLGNVTPNEKDNFPMKLGTLPPATARVVLLHFEQVHWSVLGDGPYAQATASLDLSEEWSVRLTLAQPLSTNTTVSAGPSHMKSEYTGIPVELDKASTILLQHRTNSP
jgi:hypothetical protein